MTSKYVNPRTVETFFRIATSKAKTRTSPKTILSLNEDSFSKVFETYSEMVDKPKYIADKLAEVIKNSNPDDIISKSEHEEARKILETTDIDTFKKISSIIDNDKLYIKHKSKISALLDIKYLELIVVIVQQNKLQVLNKSVKDVKSRLTKIERDNDDKKYDFDISMHVNPLNEILVKIKVLQKEAKNILTRKNIKTLPLEIGARQNSIEKGIKEKETEINKLLERAKTLLRKM
jgi:hypothetical protein